MALQSEDFFFKRPQTSDHVNIGQRLLPSNLPRLYVEKPRVGLVITTYGAPAYVELALAARQRIYPALPVLVHDDASPEEDALLAICDRYNVTFESNSSRLGHEMGDLSGIAGGLHWARSLGLDLLVKMSRRCVPLANWVEPLQELASTTQFATFGRACPDFGLPLRTECIALGVQPWCATSVLDELTRFMLTNHASILVENYVYQLATRAYEFNCEAARRWERDNVIRLPRLPFVDWAYLSGGRRQHSPNYLWYETAPVEAYAQMARALGLGISPQSFKQQLTQEQK